MISIKNDFDIVSAVAVFKYSPANFCATARQYNNYCSLKVLLIFPYQQYRCVVMKQSF